jgi:hypothetical protein
MAMAIAKRHNMNSMAVTQCVFLNLLIWAGFTSGVMAQRDWIGCAFSDDAGERVFTHSTRSASAEWAWRVGSISSTGLLRLPSSYSGGATLIDANTLLVSGWDGSNGWLAEVAFSQSGSIITPSITSIMIGGIDALVIGFQPSSSMLFAVNESDRSLVGAHYTPGQAASIGPWQTLATAQQCEVLRVPFSFLRLQPLDNATGVVIAATDIYRIHGEWEAALDAAGNWTLTDLRAAQPPVSLPATWFVSAFPLLDASSSHYDVWVGGGQGAFSIVSKRTGDVAFSASHAGGPNGETFLIPVGALAYGELYFVQSAGGQQIDRSSYLSIEAIWPLASVDARMVPARVSVRPDFPTVGTDFVSWQLYWSSGQAQPSDPMLLTMLVGGWDFYSNPTAPALGLDLLAVQYGSLGVQAASWGNRGQVEFGWALAVNNPALVGLRVAMQAFGMLPTGQFISSDVIGVEMVR